LIDNGFTYLVERFGDRAPFICPLPGLPLINSEPLFAPRLPLAETLLALQQIIARKHVNGIPDIGNYRFRRHERQISFYQHS
jgi:hypothetical protein